MSRQAKREARELELLIAARAVIGEEGILDFRMAELARRAGYSVGTLYAHFESKEDVILAVANQSVARLSVLIERLSGLPLGVPQRLLGIVAADFRRRQSDPGMAELEQLVLNPSVWRRASRERVRELRGRIDACSGRVRGLMAEAEASDEFAASPPAGWVDILDYGLWGLVSGLNGLAGVREHIARRFDHSLDPSSPLLRNTVALINSMPWHRPLDDAAVREVLAEVERLVVM